MPMEFTVNAERRRVEVVVTGRIAFDEIRRALDAAVAQPGFQPGFDILSDHTGLEEPISVADLEATLLHIESLAPCFANSRWAIATRNPASYGMMRMFSALAERIPLTVEVFRSREDAERWLEGTDQAS